MPIKFRCHYCDQLLGIARRKAGSIVSCPKCDRALTVPQEDAAAVAAQSEGKDSILERQDFDQFIGKPREIVGPLKEKVPPELPSDETPAPPVVERAEPVERRVQADDFLNKVESNAEATPPKLSPKSENSSSALTVIAVSVILAVFGLGIVVGRYALPYVPTPAKPIEQATPKVETEEDADAVQPEIPPPPPVQPVVDGPQLTGTILYSEENGPPKPDQGAIVLVFPSTQTPDRKFDSLGLRPLDQNLQDKPGIEQLRQYGGQISSVGADGTFSIRVPKTGLYYVLVLSRHESRDTSRPLYVDDRTVLSRFFAEGDEVLGSHAFLLVTRELLAGTNEPVRYTF